MFNPRRRDARPPSPLRERLSNMFLKVMAGTVTREEGTVLINSLAKENLAGTIKELKAMIDSPPPGVFPKTVLHTIALSRNRSFFRILVDSLDHRHEDVSVLAAHELAMLKTGESLAVLAEHMNSEIYHVRKASATALVEGFGAEGIRILKEHVITHPEVFFRATSASALARAGRPGHEALLEIIASGGHEPAISAAEALAPQAPRLTEGDVKTVVDALESAVAKNDTQVVMEHLRLLGAVGAKARGYEARLKALLGHSYDEIRKAAADTLRRINPL